MDPTKPILSTCKIILDLEGPNTGCFYRDITVKPVKQIKFEDKYQQLEYERNFYKDEYERLFEAYQKLKQKLESSQQLRLYISQLESKVNSLEYQGSTNRDNAELRALREKNDQLSQTILSKNYELQDAYRRIQDNGKRSSVQGSNLGQRVLTTVDRLQDGVKQAIFGNFEQLKNNTIGNIKNITKSSTQTVNYSTTKNVYSTPQTYTINQPIVRSLSPGSYTYPQTTF